MAGWQDAPVIGGAATPPPNAGAPSAAWQAAPVVNGNGAPNDGSYTPGYTDASGAAHPPKIVIRGAKPILPPSNEQQPNAKEQQGPNGPPSTQEDILRALAAIPSIMVNPAGAISSPENAAAAHAFIDQIPGIGHFLTEGTENVGAAGRSAVTGQPFDQTKAAIQSDTAALAKNYPTANTAGQVAGAVAPLVAGGEIPAVAESLGLESSVANPVLNFAARTGASAASSAILGGADTLARTGDLGEAGRSALESGAIGAVLPGAGDLVAKGLSAVGGKVARTFDDAFNPDRAAQRATAGAINQDLKLGTGMSRADARAAANNGQPIINADRFGGNVRTLARTAANVDPSAEAALKDATQQRFLTQNQRATDFVKRVTGGNVDDLALQDQITSAARKSNDAAYRASYAAPGADSVWTPEIKQLFQSPDFLTAVRGAERTAANDAATSGTKAVRNPFQFNADGSIVLKRNADGSVATPSLQFWDIVQRNLRTNSEEAYRGGKNLLGSQLKDIRTQLVGSLDKTMPQFAKARAGAAAAFGAEDALEAGRNFVTQTKGIPEARAAYAKFSMAERKAFAVGFASSLIDKIGAARDGVNVINQVFGSPASRAQVELALGKPAAAELEQFVRIENIMQETKNAVGGNSSTVKQLIASGIVGGGLGAFLGNGNPKDIASDALLAMIGRIGARALGKQIDQRVMVRVAKMLSSENPNALKAATKMAASSQQAALAVRAMQQGFQALAQAAAVSMPSLAASRAQ